jgi:hypothetical protein
MVWNLVAAVVLVVLDRRFRLGHGKVFALYVVLYTAGRFWIEALRIDEVNEIGGFRLNNYTSLILFVAALAWFLWLVKNRPGREEIVEGDGLVGGAEGDEPGAAAPGESAVLPADGTAEGDPGSPEPPRRGQVEPDRTPERT